MREIEEKACRKPSGFQRLSTKISRIFIQSAGHDFADELGRRSSEAGSKARFSSISCHFIQQNHAVSLKCRGLDPSKDRVRFAYGAASGWCASGDCGGVAR